MALTYKHTTHAKVILCGEHAVLRGSPALVLPLFKKTITLSYINKQNEQLQLTCQGLNKKLASKSFWLAFNQALLLSQKSSGNVVGSFLLENNIPIGAGIGFSSALCVAIAYWFQWKNWLPNQYKDIFNFSKKLEDVFHGKSSGLDIAGAITNKILRYRINHPYVEITPVWHPKLYLTYANQSSITAVCIKKVEHLWRCNPLLAKHLDNNMEQSVNNAEAALQLPMEIGLIQLQQAMEQAFRCFDKWNLISNEMQQHINMLKQAGALASKPTGSGHGGYVLSLWREQPCLKSMNEILPVMIAST